MRAFNTVDEAIEDLKKGKIILVTDDAERENEGDFICAAEFATTENINFMATYGKGLICMPMSEDYVKKLEIPQMVDKNTDNHETAFTVSIDHVSTSTGISAAERSATALACVAKMRSQKISADLDICFLCWQRKTAYWNETDTQRLQWIYAVWPV